MHDEWRPPYKPNVYLTPCGNSANHTHCNDVEQVRSFNTNCCLHNEILYRCAKVCFPGVHSDAWEPSQLVQNVLQYLLDDLAKINVHVTIDAAQESRGHRHQKKRLGSIFFLRPPSVGLTNYVIRHIPKYSNDIKLRSKFHHHHTNQPLPPHNHLHPRQWRGL
jgi:hypothetical protein